MPTNYDQTVIQTFADRLYRRAATIVISYAVLGMLCGAGIGYGISEWTMASLHHRMAAPGFALVLVAATLIGIAIGRERAFALRLAAQTALCQAQIERNTRRSAT